VAVDKISKNLYQYAMMAKVANVPLDEVVTSFEKMEKRGYATGRMLSQVRDVPIIPMLRQMYIEVHKNDKGFDQFIQKRVGFNLIEQAIDRMTAAGTNFNKAAQEMFETPTSMMEIAHNALRIYIDDLMEAMFGTNNNTESLKKLRDKIIELEVPFKQWANTHKDLLKMGVYALGAAAALSVLAGAAAFLLLLISPITLIGVGLAAAGYAAYKLYTDFKTQLKQIAQFFLDFLLNPIQAVEDRFKSLIQHVKTFFGLFTSQPTINLQPNIATPQLGAVGGLNVGTSTANVGIDMRVHDRTNAISSITSTSKGLSNFNIDRGHSTAFAGGY
jgi:hypothetical protein